MDILALLEGTVYRTDRNNVFDYLPELISYIYAIIGNAKPESLLIFVVDLYVFFFFFYLQLEIELHFTANDNKLPNRSHLFPLVFQYGFETVSFVRGDRRTSTQAPSQVGKEILNKYSKILYTMAYKRTMERYYVLIR